MSVAIEPVLNMILPDNSVTVSKKRSSGSICANCPVKKKNRTKLDIAVPVIVPSTVAPPVKPIPVMDSKQSIFTYLRAIKDEGWEQFATCNAKCSSSRGTEML